MHDFIRSCVLSKGSDVIHDRRNLTVCSYQGRLFHATPDIVISCVQSMGDDVMPRAMFPTVCVVQER